MLISCCILHAVYAIEQLVTEKLICISWDSNISEKKKIIECCPRKNYTSIKL